MCEIISGGLRTWNKSLPSAVEQEFIILNLASRGKRIVCTQGMALVTTTFLGLFCWYAFTQTDATCGGEVLGLRSWYLGAFVLECASVLCFFCIMYSVLSVWSSQAAPGAARAAEVVEVDEEAVVE